MPSADQVPVKSAHSTMLWPMWVVLIAGSTGSALRAVRPPNLPDPLQIAMLKGLIAGRNTDSEIEFGTGLVGPHLMK
jgi:hypothetical protein